jgi:hypothetical protein
MHWPCGPLEAARLAAKQALTPELKKMVAAWADPQSLELIKGTPINCLVVPWAAGMAEDREQRQSLEPLVRAAAAAGISCAGTITTKQDRAGLLAAGLKAGLAAFMVDSLEGLPNDAPVILRVTRSGIPWEFATSILDITENLWPGLGMDNMKEGDTANAGPTGVPWVNSNGWLSLLARRLAHGKSIWLECEPPESSDLAHPADYAMAIADSQAYGSRWVISLDDRLRVGLIDKDPRALKAWENITRSLSFFKDKEEWGRYQPIGFLAVISDFRGDNEFLSTEVLNLLARRHVQYKIIERSAAASVSLTYLKAILWIDDVTPGDEVRARLLDFVRRGGLLIAPAHWGPAGLKATAGGLLDRYEVRTVGKGRIAVPREGFKDPYDVAVDAHLLLSRRNDWVRVFNATAVNAYCADDAAGRKRLVQILNYASAGTEHPVSVWVRTANRAARFWHLDSREPIALRGTPSRGGTEFQLPSVSAYTALEFDLQGRR